MIVNVQTSASSVETLKAALAKCTLIPFNAYGKQVLKATEALDKVAVKSKDAIAMTLQQFVDANAQANGRSEASCKALQKAIAESEVVNNSVALGQMERKTWTEYAQSAARALYWNVPFEQGLKNDSEKALPWSKKSKTDSTTKAGAVQSTSREALDATLSKAIQQARLLGLTEFSATLLDHCLDSLEGFKETEAK
jgi:hypothetical protein